MSVMSMIAGGGVENAGKGIAAVVNAIKGRNPEDAAKLQEIMGRHADLVVSTEADVEKAKIQENISLNETAGQNIRAEQASRYTAWARPSIVYCWIGVVLYNYVFCSLLHRAQLPIPDMFWQYSGIVIGGYVFVRSGQEIASKVVGGAGGSFSLPGIKVDSKGD